MMSFDSRYIERLRAHMMFSQKHMAELIGVSRQMYIKYTTNKSMPRKEKRDEIIAILTKVVDLLLSQKYVSMPALSYQERYDRLKKLL